MKKITLRLILLLGIGVHLNLCGFSQLSDYIYAINSNSGYYFSKINISTGVITNLQPAPITTLSGTMSACINNVTPRYYLCTGSSLITFDPVTGNVISNVTLPISGPFLYIQYNPCDNYIYGILSNSSERQFARYNPESATMTVISSLNIPNIFMMGGISTIDPDSGIYSVHISNFVGIRIATGEILYNTSTGIAHEALECSTGRIVGTHAGGLGKMLASFNPYTGITTNISTTGWSPGLWKPANGGDCIDQASGIYYYSGQGATIIGVDVSNGNMVYNQNVNSAGELYFIQHFSQCTCLMTDVTENGNLPENSLLIFPNPVTDGLNIEGVSGKTEINLYNTLGEKIMSREFDGGEIKLVVKNLAPGIYVVKVAAGDKVFVKKVVKG